MGDGLGLEDSQSYDKKQSTHQQGLQDSGLTLAFTRAEQGVPGQKLPVIEETPTNGNEHSELDLVIPKHDFPDNDQILRFKESERLLHWAIAVPFVLCWITALTLEVVYNPEPTRPLRDLLSWVHRICGAFLIILPMLAVIRGRKDLRLHLYNVKTAWRWYVRDLKWLALMLPAALIKRISLPEQNKFNAAEKINFMLVMMACPVFAVTGLMMWMQGIPWVSWLIHVSVAVVVTPVTLGHIYMAMVNPGTRKGLTGMISGYVDRRWAKHHYVQWYQEEFVRSASRNGVHTDVKKESAE